MQGVVKWPAPPPGHRCARNGQRTDCTTCLRGASRTARTSLPRLRGRMGGRRDKVACGVGALGHVRAVPTASFCNCRVAAVKIPDLKPLHGQRGPGSRPGRRSIPCRAPAARSTLPAEAASTRSRCTSRSRPASLWCRTASVPRTQLATSTAPADPAHVCSEGIGTIALEVMDCLDMRNHAQSAAAGHHPGGRSFSNVETTFRLRRRPRISKFETNQPLVDKA